FCMPAYYPQPQITSTFPAYIVPDGSSKTITIEGTGFQSASQIQINFVGQTTTFIPDSQLQFSFQPATSYPFQSSTGAGYSASSSYAIRVLAPYTFASPAANFAINLPPPVITSVQAVLNNTSVPCT